MKFLTTNRVDWWFVYTDISRKLLHQLGFSEDKITTQPSHLKELNYYPVGLEKNSPSTRFRRKKLLPHHFKKENYLPVVLKENNYYPVVSE